jgi:hypothetical protein
MKNTIGAIFILISIICKSQIINEGDITLSPNVGVPHVSSFILKTALKVYYKSNLQNKYQIGVKNTPVFNFKGEYFAQNDVSIGLAASYWKMDIDISDIYDELNQSTNIVETQLDNTTISIEVVAVGFRGNYHFLADEKNTKWDPYMGGTLGISRYQTNIQFKSSVLGKEVPEKMFNFKTGIATYFSSTVGVRYYATKNFGINLEAGWDKGALFFGGIVVKFPTKKQLEEEPKKE